MPAMNLDWLQPSKAGGCGTVLYTLYRGHPICSPDVSNGLASDRRCQENGIPFLGGESHECHLDEAIYSLEQGQAGWTGSATEVEKIRAIRSRLQLAGKARDMALFNLVFDSKLRGCDLVSLRGCVIAPGKIIPARAMVMQRKTHRPVQFEITEQARRSVAAWIEKAHLAADQCRFPGRAAKPPTF
jgi:hypothetical protein